MEHSSGNGRTRPDERYRWVFVYGIGGDLRFISHHDTLRLFRRALARANVAVRFSEGFNPHPRIMIPLPRPVGVASDVEAIIIETEVLLDPNDALQRLQHHTPADLRMIEARRLQPGEQLQPGRVRYRMEAADVPMDDLIPRARHILESGIVEVTRVDPKSLQSRSVDIRPYIVDIRVVPQAVEFTLHVTGGGTAKPAEIAGLLGYDAGSINHRIRRMEIQWR